MQALSLLQNIWRSQVVSDVTSYSAAISTCEKGRQWEQALCLLKEIWRSQLVPDLISYNAAISACEKGQQ